MSNSMEAGPCSAELDARHEAGIIAPGYLIEHHRPDLFQGVCCHLPRPRWPGGSLAGDPKRFILVAPGPARSGLEPLLTILRIRSIRHQPELKVARG